MSVPEAADTVADMTRHLLVVATAPDPSDELLERLSKDAADDDVEIEVVAPASDLSPLQWLVDDDARARQEAERRAREAAAANAPIAKVVDARVGDPDPVTAVADALQTFPADELVVVTRPKDTATWLEKRAIMGELERFGLPVTHLVDDDAGEVAPERAGVLVRAGDDLVRLVVKHLVLTLLLVAGIFIGVAFAVYSIVR
jgi:hypothetical protein